MYSAINFEDGPFDIVATGCRADDPLVVRLAPNATASSWGTYLSTGLDADAARTERLRLLSGGLRCVVVSHRYRTYSSVDLNAMLGKLFPVENVVGIRPNPPTHVTIVIRDQEGEKFVAIDVVSRSVRSSEDLERDAARWEPNWELAVAIVDSFSQLAERRLAAARWFEDHRDSPEARDHARRVAQFLARQSRVS